MKVFVDANILVSVLIKEYPLFTHSARILSLSGKDEFEIYTSPVCLAIAFYFAGKKNKKTAKEKMALLCSNISIAPATASAVRSTIASKKINDFEDGLEYYSAIECKCACVVTEDTKDFYFSDIPVLTAKMFFEQYVVKRKLK